MICRKKPINESDKSSVGRVDSRSRRCCRIIWLPSLVTFNLEFYRQLNKTHVTIQPSLDRSVCGNAMLFSTVRTKRGA